MEQQRKFMKEFIKDSAFKIYNTPSYMVSLYMFIGVVFLIKVTDGFFCKFLYLLAAIFLMLFFISFAGFVYREFNRLYERISMYFVVRYQRNLYKKYQISLQDAQIQKEQKEFWQDRYMREEYEKKYWQKLFFSKKNKEGFDSLTKKELKTIYKKAVNLCHPDKAKKKDEANEVFIELQSAYESRDSSRVISIYINLLVDRYKLD
ncbi:J domain-containing protein [Campylobacter corcagiensis]|nr:J domain-containing protein [Campylobacter corcagiensis]